MKENSFVLYHDLSVSDALENLADMVDVLAETAEQPHGMTLMLWTVRDSLRDAAIRLNKPSVLTQE